MVIFKILRRQFSSQGIYFIANILGLSIGLSCALLIMLRVYDEYSYDKFLQNNRNVHQVWMNQEFGSETSSQKALPLPAYQALKTASPHILNTTVSDWGTEHLLTSGKTKIRKAGHFAGKEFLEMFQFELISGDPSQVLDKPSSIVITESTAIALFGEIDVLGYSLLLDSQYELIITGVLKDIPDNSSFDFSFLVPWEYGEQIYDWVRLSKDNWTNNSFQVYVELDNYKYKRDVEAHVKDILKNNGQDERNQRFFFHPLNRWHLHSKFTNGVEAGGRIDYLTLFTSIAGLILIIACINFMNLTTARSEKRIKEVGLRKSLGDSRLNIIKIFLFESLIATTIALLLALVFASLLLPLFNNLVEKSLTINLVTPLFSAVLLVSVFVITILTGLYPAIYISSFKPSQVLKGKITTGSFANNTRKILLIFQYGISIILIMGTIVLLAQINLVQKRELGYEQERLITVRYNDEMGKNYEALKRELINSNTAIYLTKSNSPVTSIHSSNIVGWQGKPDGYDVTFTTVATEYDYLKTMGIQLFEGRDFSPDYPSDSTAVLINKAALAIMNLQQPIGSKIKIWDEERTIIGVFDNVLMGSVFEPIEPMVLVFDPGWVSRVTIRLNADLSNSLEATQSAFAKHNPSYPFEFSFVDENYKRKFSSINLIGNVAKVFTFLALLISALGLLSLVSFMAEKRTKEIGIRKVLGASVRNIIMLMSKDFVKLVFIALVIFIPIAVYLVNWFMQQYTLRVDVEWWTYAATCFTIILLSLLIVWSQTFKAANINPALTLKHND